MALLNTEYLVSNGFPPIYHNNVPLLVQQQQTNTTHNLIHHLQREMQWSFEANI